MLSVRKSNCSDSELSGCVDFFVRFVLTRCRTPFNPAMRLTNNWRHITYYYCVPGCSARVCGPIVFSPRPLIVIPLWMFDYYVYCLNQFGSLAGAQKKLFSDLFEKALLSFSHGGGFANWRFIIAKRSVLCENATVRSFDNLQIVTYKSSTELVCVSLLLLFSLLQEVLCPWQKETQNDTR